MRCYSMATKPLGPKGIPIIGNTQRFLDDPLTFMTACRDAYGDLSKFDLGTDEAYLLTNPADIKHVLSRDTALTLPSASAKRRPISSGRRRSLPAMYADSRTPIRSSTRRCASTRQSRSCHASPEWMFA